MITIDDLVNKLIGLRQGNVDEVRLESQKRVWAEIVKPGSSTLAVLPTGTGKSALYSTFAAHEKCDGIVIVVEPLKSIIEDQKNKYNRLAGDISCLDDKAKLNRIRIIYVSPEQLVQNSQRIIETFSIIKMIVVDEIHTLFDWGSSFRSDFLYIPTFIKLVKAQETNEDLRVLLLTATLTSLKEELCKKLIEIDSVVRDEYPFHNSIVKETSISSLYSELISEHRNLIYDDISIGELQRKELVFFREKKDIKYFEKALDEYENSRFN